MSITLIDKVRDFGVVIDSELSVNVYAGTSSAAVSPAPAAAQLQRPEVTSNRHRLHYGCGIHCQPSRLL